MKKRVTLSQISQRVGVSPVAVGAALGLLSSKSSVRLSPEKAEMIRNVATEMGYRPNHLARAFRKQHTRTIGVLIRVIENQSDVNYLIDQIHRELLKHDYRVSLTPYFDRFDLFDRNVRDLVHWRVDGLIFCHVFQTDDPRKQWPDLEQWLDQAKVPFVFVESDLNTTIPRSSIKADLGKAMELVTRHLLELGHRRLAFASDGGNVTRDRREGIERALREAPGATLQVLQPARVLPSTPILEMAESFIQTGREVAAMESRPTAIITSNDLLAAAICRGLNDEGLRVPADISVTGYGNLRESIIHDPALTSIEVPANEIASSAVQALLDQIDDFDAPKPICRHDPKLIIRSSTGPVNPAVAASRISPLPTGERR